MTCLEMSCTYMYTLVHPTLFVYCPIQMSVRACNVLRVPLLVRQSFIAKSMGGCLSVKSLQKMSEDKQGGVRAAASQAEKSPQQFRLNDTAQLSVEKGDITKFEGDAIVNAANERCLGGGGVDGAIHSAAGHGLYMECKELEEVEHGVRCPTGEARITGGHDLPAKHVIHTVGPIYSCKEESEPLLYGAYKSSLDLANDRGLKTIAFPAISCGVFGYPIRDAADVAIKACKENVGSLREICLIQFSDKNLRIFLEAATDILEASH